MNNFKIYFISILNFVIFGITDASLFLGVESGFVKILKNISFFDDNMIQMTVGAISASIAIFISSFINIYLHKHFKIIEHPLLDVFGILFGTFIVILIYYIFSYHITNKKLKSEFN
jgi:hypothetical protein